MEESSLEEEEEEEFGAAKEGNDGEARIEPRA